MIEVILKLMGAALTGLITVLLLINLVVLGEGFSHQRLKEDCTFRSTRLAIYIGAHKSFRLGCWLGETQ